ncbi:DUF4124 domain-containing protein [Thauera sp. CAU 1555]|jgi:hypothetical protein|uniref:DUF4124 domain-containing protein n=2 Tax=Thauera sedimentorum TaxID=2767595 RepID=A0ABR9BEI4_9RHOO|nr:DUF4124 domain-containing protein [Thauera sedimentorum]MBD8504428.1 DUF4124 domain-containing protein [Thauera sedimentorum]
MKTPMHRLLLLLTLLAGSAHAQVYKCVDEEGRVTYTNDRTIAKGCTQLSQDQPVSTIPAPAARPSPAPSAAPQNFPRVSPDAQRERDQSRRQILEKELAQEESALAEAQKALADQEAVRYGNERNYQRVLDRLAPFKEKVEQHQRNVDALKRELRELR